MISYQGEVPPSFPGEPLSLSPERDFEGVTNYFSTLTTTVPWTPGDDDVGTWDFAVVMHDDDGNEIGQRQVRTSVSGCDVAPAPSGWQALALAVLLGHRRRR